MKRFKTHFKYILIGFLLAVLSCGFLIIPNNSVAYAQTQANTYSTTARAKLNAKSQKLYDFLKGKIQAVSNGTLTSTKFEADATTITSWGASINYSDLNNFMAQFEMRKIIDAIRFDMPYEFCWFGNSYSTTGTLRTQGSVKTINSISISFAVSQDYRPSAYNSSAPTVNSSKINSVKTALQNAQSIVTKHSGKTDYEKVVAYKEEICALTEYNNAAAGGGVAYGDPWQLVYVFDNNTATNVVCEGYAKAFQLLCNLTTFDSNIQSNIVTGHMGQEGHMWNVITMDDGKNYIVDVTNSDSTSIGNNGGLFLNGTAGSVAGGYSFALPGKTITYTYDDDTKNLWGTTTSSILNLTNGTYTQPTNPSVSKNKIKITFNGKTYNKAAITAGLSSADLVCEFEDASINETDYNWIYEWYTDLNNNQGTKLTTAPVNAGTYWLNVKAVNKANTSDYSIKSEKFTIDQVFVNINGATAANKVYDGTKNIAVTITGSNIVGVLSGDSIQITATGTLSNSNAGSIHSKVDLSNLTITGTDKGNYKLQSTTATGINLTSPISITKAEPTLSTVTKVTEDGKKLKDIALEFKGTQGEGIQGTIEWYDEDGNVLSSETEIEKDKEYTYKFTPTGNSNYKEITGKVSPWNAQKGFILENLPKILEYALYVYLGICVISIIFSLIRRRRNKSL